MLDGRHTGTGGGNHVVLGGPTPADSPFLRRPDLLKSFVGYWLNHPSLSYLFSGIFIGPTSQAPRVDETRADAVYELEIAFEPARAAPARHCPPWLVDRIFRNLLVDVTGNTHRAEFCIDKLYSPDSATGRLGLLELRAFEMPPHARMSLAQQLLVRALLAWFWREPYEATPIRWGTRLHDRFLLPLLRRARLRRGHRRSAARRLPARPRVVRAAPRVPLSGVRPRRSTTASRWSCGRRSSRGTCSAKSRARGGTARYVDSSVERLQVQRARASMAERYTVACNGRQLPLQPTGTEGEFVCGVRYRAWQPPRCLHPTIPVHTPLVFDVVDLAARRADRRLHVSRRPIRAGGTTTTLPVNSNEAEARRRARFFAFGHTPGAPLTLRHAREPRVPVHARSAAAGRVAQRRGLIDRVSDTSSARAVAQHGGLELPAAAGGTLGRSARSVRAPAPALDAAGRGAAPHGAAGVLAALGVRPAAHSAPTASPTTSTATRRAARGRGRWTRFRWSSTAHEWAQHRARRHPARHAAQRRSSPISTARTVCVRDGHLPPELVFANPGFLRAVPRHRAARAASTCRTTRWTSRARPNGDWWVISDRTQAPSGVGYALENRLVSARTLPAMLDQCHVRPLHRLLRGDDQGAAGLAPNRPRQPARRGAVGRARTARPTSSTRSSRGSGTSRWSTAPISPCATAASISRRSPA